MQYFIVDAFSDRPFAGNPAGICLCQEWPPEETMRRIAAENNLSETAFVRRRTDGEFDIRWFTPAIEIDLCGHATLGSAYVIANHTDFDREEIVFHSALSGRLTVRRQGDQFVLDFPSRPPLPIEITEAMRAAVNAPILKAYDYRDLFLLLGSEAAVGSLTPNLEAISAIPGFTSIVVMAKGESPGTDFVSRCFAPLEGIPEDPVTGSTHASLIPFWSKQLGKTEMTARQLSPRGGTLQCRDGGERVYIAGSAALYLRGELLPGTEF